MAKLGPGDLAPAPQRQIGDEAACGLQRGAVPADLVQSGGIGSVPDREGGQPFGGGPGIGGAQCKRKGDVGQARQGAIVGQGGGDRGGVMCGDGCIMQLQLRQNQIAPKRGQPERLRQKRGHGRRQAQPGGQEHQDRGGAAGPEGVADRAQEAVAGCVRDRILVALGAQDQKLALAGGQKRRPVGHRRCRRQDADR